MRNEPMECPRCGEIELVVTGTVLERDHCGHEYECESCGHYEVAWFRVAPLQPVKLEVVV